MNLLRFIRKTFSFDNRSMGLYRILLGLVVIIDVLGRWEDLGDFYTDSGLLPRSLFLSEVIKPFSFSLHFANGSHGFIVFLFFLQLLAGLILSLGLKTRWATVAAWILTVSVENRNPFVNDGGDAVLRSLLFISIFLPLGRSFSLDSLRNRKDDRAIEFFSTWNLAFFGQVFLLYLTSYLFKDNGMWRKDFTAFFWFSHMNLLATSLTVTLREWPRFGNLITAFTLYLELLGPLLLVSSFFFGRFWWHVRFVLIFLFLGFHIGILLTFNVNIFPLICIALWAMFLPPHFWKFLQKRLKQSSLVRDEAGPRANIQIKFFRRASEAAGVFTLAIIIMWKLGTLNNKYMSPFVRIAGLILNLNQQWNMFSYPRKENNWIEVPAVLSDGTLRELLSGESDLLSRKEYSFLRSIPNDRWRRIYLHLARQKSSLTRFYGDYLCRKWNRSGHKVKVKKMEIITYSQAHLPDRRKGEASRKFSMPFFCFSQID